MKNVKRKMLFCVVWGIGVLVVFSPLMACQVVEPEKRAYPQVISVDRREEEQEYTVWMYLASLAKDTGQGKESDEVQPGNSLYFHGKTKEDIRTAYETTREQYLDIGHVKAVIFSKKIWENKNVFRQVLEKMESESSLGNSPYVFLSDQLEDVAQTAEEQGISLGDFLTGLYENRTDAAGGQSVKLADLYRAEHQRKNLPRVPEICIKDRRLQIRKLEDEVL